MIIYKTHNNIRVVISPINIQEVVSVGMFFKVGSQDEKKDSNGITHLIEHIVSEQFINDCSIVSGRANAITTKEYCCFFSKAFSSKIEDVLRCLKNICNYDFNENEIIKAKKIVINEMQEIEEEQYVEQQIFEEHLNGDALRFLPIGRKENIEKLTKQQIEKHYCQYFRPDNCAISIVGFVDEDKTLKYIEDIFSNWKMGIVINDIGTEFLKGDKKVISKWIRLQKKSSSIRILFDGVKRDSEEKNAVAALCNYLGGGAHSKLFHFIRKELLAYNAFCISQSFASRGIVYLKIEGVTGSASIVMEKVSALLVKLAEEKITYESLEQIRKRLIENYVYKHETLSSKMTLNGLQLLFDDYITSDKKMIESLNNIREKDIEKAFSNIMSNSITMMFDSTDVEKTNYFDRFFEEASCSIV